MTYDTSRLLLNPTAPDARDWAVAGQSDSPHTGLHFRTGGVNGKTAEDTAIGNLADMSEHADYVLVLFDDDYRIVATARAGLIQIRANR